MTFEKGSDEDDIGGPVGIREKSILGRGNNTCKGTEAARAGWAWGAERRQCGGREVGEGELIDEFCLGQEPNREQMALCQ